MQNSSLKYSPAVSPIPHNKPLNKVKHLKMPSPVLSSPIAKDSSFLSSTKLTPMRSPRYALSKPVEESAPLVNMSHKNITLNSTRYNSTGRAFVPAKTLHTTPIVSTKENKDVNIPTHQAKYGVPGLFPVVHFHPNKIPVITPKSNQVVAKLSSSSSVCLLGPGFDLPSQQPELDEPVPSTSSVTDHDGGTKSVLDALKEISKKRIHGDSFESDKTPSKKLNDYNSNKRVRDEDTSPRSQSSPPAPATKRVCVVDPVFASSTSSEIIVSNKRKAIFLDEGSPIEAKPRKKVASVETQTVDVVPLVKESPTVLQQTIKPSEVADKVEEEPLIAEVKEGNLNANVLFGQQFKLFDEDVHSLQKKNKLAMILSKITGESPAIIPKEDTTDSAAAASKDLPGIVSIMSPKDKTKHDKHVHFAETVSIKENSVEKIAMNEILGTLVSNTPTSSTYTTSMANNGSGMAFGTFTDSSVNFKSQDVAPISSIEAKKSLEGEKGQSNISNHSFSFGKTDSQNVNAQTLPNATLNFTTQNAQMSSQNVTANSQTAPTQQNATTSALSAPTTSTTPFFTSKPEISSLQFSFGNSQPKSPETKTTPIGGFKFTVSSTFGTASPPSISTLPTSNAPPISAFASGDLATSNKLNPNVSNAATNATTRSSIISFGSPTSSGFFSTTPATTASVPTFAGFGTGNTSINTGNISSGTGNTSSNIGNASSNIGNTSGITGNTSNANSNPFGANLNASSTFGAATTTVSTIPTFSIKTPSDNNMIGTTSMFGLGTNTASTTASFPTFGTPTSQTTSTFTSSNSSHSSSFVTNTSTAKQSLFDAKTNPTSIFGVAVNASATSTTPAFGATNAFATGNNIATGNVATGNIATGNMATGNSVAIGNNIAMGNSMPFNMTNNTLPAFGQSNTVTTTTSTTSFGGFTAAKSNNATTQGPVALFGNPSTTTAPFGLASNSTSTANNNAFGGGGFGANANSGGFNASTFGGFNTGNAFDANKTATTTATFGMATNQQAPAFANNNSALNNTCTMVFGDAVKTFRVPTTTTTAGGSFSFGNSSANTAAAAPGFGFNAPATTTTAAASFGNNGGSSSSGIFTFGAPAPTATTTSSNGFAFGSTNSAPVFGTGNVGFSSSNTPAPAFGTATAPPAFGSTSTQFGAANKPPTQNGFGATNAPVFGGGFNPPSTTTAFGSFGNTNSFTPGNNLGSNTFGNAAPPPNFNAGSNASNNNSAFGSFGAPAASSNTAFQFNANPAPSANIAQPTGVFAFGASEAPKPSGTFNFTAPTGAASAFGATGQQQPANMFNIGSAGTPTRPRLHIRAKRRT